MLNQMKNYFSALSRLFVTGTTVPLRSHYADLEPTPEMKEEARRNPNGWVYVIRWNYGPNDAVPPEAIAGAWKVDASGNIISGSFISNPKCQAK